MLKPDVFFLARRGNIFPHYNCMRSSNKVHLTLSIISIMLYVYFKGRGHLYGPLYIEPFVAPNLFIIINRLKSNSRFISKPIFVLHCFGHEIES